MLHKNIPLGDIHYIHNWEVANAAALAALTPTAADRGKLVWKLDTNEFFFLANHVGPVWIGALGVGGPVGPRGAGLLSGDVVPTTEGADGDFYWNPTTQLIYGPKAAGAWPAGVLLKGDTGQGVPAGGALNMVLTKGSGADFDTIWSASSGAGTTVSVTPPASPTNGQGWYDLNTGVKYTWVGDGDSYAWVEDAAAVSVTPVAFPLQREMLTANRTYYVATTGSDLNDGKTVGLPFLTIQKAIDVALSIDASIYQVTIQVADGTYTAPVIMPARMLGKFELIIQGNAAAPANVHINCAAADAVLAKDGAILYIKDLKISNTGNFSLRSDTKAHVNFGNIDFGPCGAQQLGAGDLASITCMSNYSISGGAAVHMITVNGTIRIQAKTITLTGTPAFANCFAAAEYTGVILANGNTYVGAATGSRYACSANGVLYTGGVATYLPGSIAGTVVTGAQYV